MSRVLLGSLVVLGSCVVLAMGCGGDSGSAGDGGGRDSSVPDSSVADDASAGDSATGDSAVGDASTDDSAVSDASTGDAGSDGAMTDAATSDAAVTWPMGCGTPEPAWSDLTVGEPGTCPVFTACGGDIVGAWNLSGGCFEIAINDAFSRCPGATVTRMGRGRGCVNFGADGVAHRVAESVVDIDIFVPALCAGFVSCASIESQMRARGLDASCPADAAGNCDCTASLVTRIDDTDGYTTAGDEIIGAASGKHWGYCVAGDQLMYQDTSATGTREPGIIELTRR